MLQGFPNTKISMWKISAQRNPHIKMILCLGIRVLAQEL
jgi:hypothetical protein